MDRNLLIGKRSSGFTLIELVVVITILGILAAFAVPRFIALQTKARAAAVVNLQGALRSAASLTHAMWMISGNPVAMEGASINMVNGYPTYLDIPNTLMDASGFTYDASIGQFSKVGAADPTKCNVTYTPPAILGDPPSIIYDPSNCN